MNKLVWCGVRSVYTGRVLVCRMFDGEKGSTKMEILLVILGLVTAIFGLDIEEFLAALFAILGFS